MKADRLLKKYTFWHDIHNELSQNIDFSQTYISEILEKSVDNSFNSIETNKNLHEYIFQFYAYNEILSAYRNKYNGIIDNEDLIIYRDYQSFVNDFSKRVFSFILYSCLCEARHSFFISNSTDNRDDNEQYNIAIHEAFCRQELTKDNSKYYLAFLEYIDRNWSPSDIESIEKNNDLLLFKFSDYIWDYYNIPKDLPKDFITDFNAQYYSSEKMLDECVYFFSQQYPEEISDIDKFSAFIQFIQHINNLGPSADNGNLQRMMMSEKTIEQSTIQHFTSEEIFQYLSVFFNVYFEHGYGGKPWSDIALHALSFCRGDINSEMFIDQALSLEHNNGQMFNKNFLFTDSVSHGNFSIIYEKNDYLHHHVSTISMTNFLLSLQNSCSVLSLHQFLHTDFNDLTENIHTLTFKNPQLVFTKEHLDFLKINFNTFKSFALHIDNFDNMLKLAQKIEYSIPTFDYVYLSSVIAEKNNKDYGYTKHNLIESLEQHGNFNYILTDILNGQYKKMNNIEHHTFNYSQSIKKLSFHLHNLNSNDSTSLSKQLIGGKAYGLINLINKGFNVPKALVLDTKTCLSYLSDPQFFNKKYKTIENQLNNYLMDDNNQPIIVSIRSGAAISMPGMMDSILNVGIDDTNYEQLCTLHSKNVIHRCIMSFMTQFCSSKLNLHIDFPKSLHKALNKFRTLLIKHDIPCDKKNLFPLSKQAQIKLCVEVVFDSWNCPRAIAWRVEKNISHSLGTAAIIQQMVFGNRNNNSLTCVVFSRDCISGSPDIMGEYLIKSQGEDLVSGKKTPLPISHLQQLHPSIYKQIEYIAKTLEQEQKAIQDLEITVENGKVYVLQMRDAVVSAKAKLLLAKELDLNLLDIISPNNLIGNKKVDTLLQPEFSGLAASPGFMSGIVVKNLADIEIYKEDNLPLIFFSQQALPEHAPLMIATQGFITQFGGATSHAAILARSMEKPCIVGIGVENLESGQYITMDALHGHIWKGIIPISLDQSHAIDLSEQILEHENIIIHSHTKSHPITLNSWVTELSNIQIFKNIPNSQHTMFLNIAQKTALALKMNTMKKNKNLVSTKTI